MALQIETVAMFEKMRSRCVDLKNKRVLVSNLMLSDQVSDLTVPPNCGGIGRVRHFRNSPGDRWPSNPLPRMPAEKWLKKQLPEPLRAQVFQLAGCAWRCWYCFVPFADLRGHESRAVWITAQQLVDLYLAECDHPQILDLSGGSPDLAPEWIAWTMDAIEARGVTQSVYLWSDDNLSSDRICSSENRWLLNRLEKFPGYGKVCCIKGFDRQSFSFNTGSKSEGFDEQLEILERYAKTNLDLYGYITLTGRKSSDLHGHICRLMDRIEAARAGLLSRIVPLRISKFGPMVERLTEIRDEALQYQWEVADLWFEELNARRICPMWNSFEKFFAL